MDESICAALSSTGWAVVPNFLSAEQVAALNIIIQNRQPEFLAAGVGRKENAAVQVQVRGDSTLWVERGDVEMTATQQRMDLLQGKLNRELFLGLQELEWHFAKYPVGSFYSRHLDQHRDQDSRLITIVLYLNQTWQESDGGQLRMYLQPGVSVDIVPYGGTLVVFRSDLFEHEVLPALVERRSLTGWYRRRGLV